MERPVGQRGEVLRIELSDFKGRTTLQVRRWYPDQNGELAPGRGASVPPHLIPFVRHAIEQAEQEALKRGLIAEEDFQLAGLPLPESLGGSRRAA